jgi:predicted small secreted protein
MKLNRYIIGGSLYIAIGSLIIMLAGCETWRGMGKDTRNVTDRTANTVDNVFSGKQKK